MIVTLLAALVLVDYSRHVEPILTRHCVTCHRAGQVAPFALDNYAEARKHARSIAAVTASRYMPPWKASHLPGAELLGERRLSAAELATLAAWARTGAPPGPVLPLKPAQPTPDWELGPPDLILEMPEAFPVAASGEDIYQCFVLPLALAQSRWVRAFAFAPGARRAVHHALFFVDSSGTGRQRDAAEPGPGYRCFGLPGFLPTASLGGWSPGNGAYEMPEGTAQPLRKNADVILQIHYHVTGAPQRDLSRLGLYFAKTPPTRQLYDVALASRQIDIPAGDAAYRVRDSITLPVAVDLLGVIPHAHYLAKQMRGWATLPSGQRRLLFEVLDWDFNWQQNYRYTKPLRLPADTRLEMDFVYDNSARNPRNPSRPPRRVGWGPETTDEMAGLHFQAVPANPEDAAELAQTLWGKLIRFLGAGGLRHTGTQHEVDPRPQP
ncbi:MAG: cytochrome c [Bryobacteraceae bacterium]|nr:cytochrome c [Bryobacteraceae bacterium]